MTQDSRAPLLCAMVAMLLSAPACGDDGQADADASGGDDATSPACMQATQQSDLQWIQDNIFTPSCASFSVCHQGGNPAGGLNLEAGNSETSLVDQPSTRFATEILVVPGEPQNSYLMVALGSYPGELSPTGTMPPANPELCIEKRQAIERWITSLAN